MANFVEFELQKRWAILLVLTLIFTSPASADAQDGEPYTRDGWYVGASAVYSEHLLESAIEDAVEGAIDVKSTMGINVRAGYRILKWLSAEAEFEWLDGFDVELVGFGRIFSLETYTLTANAVAHWPLGRWQPYFKFGVGVAEYQVNDVLGLGVNFESDTAFAARLGVGLDYYVTRNWLAHFEAVGELSTHDLGNITGKESLSGVHYLAFQLGFAYRF